MILAFRPAAGILRVMRRSSEGEREVSRRKFLQYLAVLASGVLGSAAGYRIWENETEQPFPYTDQQLLDLVPRDGRQRLFGLYPDLDRADATPWEDLDWVHQEVAPVAAVGVFATLEDFLSEKETTRVLGQMARIGDRGQEVVLSLGANARHEYVYPHPFDPRNRTTLVQLAEHAASILNQYPGKIVARLFFEANQKPFVYGPTAELSGRQHELAFIESFIAAADAFVRQRKYPTRFAFSPGIQGPVAPYFPRRGKHVYADMVGLDVYDLFPGSGKVEHENYWIYGKKSPEELIIPPLTELLDVSYRKLPVWYWELGSYTRDPEWLRHAALLLFAVGGQGLMHFNYDKRSARKPYETNWMIDDSLAAMYSTTWREVR